MADQLLLIRQSQPARRCSGRNDQRSGFVPCSIDIQAEGPLGQIRFGHRAIHVFGAEPLSLLLDVLHQVRPLNPLGKARKIFDLSSDRELPARLVSLNHQRREIGPARVNRRRIPRAA